MSTQLTERRVAAEVGKGPNRVQAGLDSGSMRVMQVITNLDVGGAQEVVRTLAENLSESGCPTVVCAFRGGPLQAEIEMAGVPVEILGDRQYSILAFPMFLTEMLRIRKRLLALVESYQVDVIQTHLLRVLDFLVLSIKFSRDVKVFWTIQNANFTLRRDHLAEKPWLLGIKKFGYRMLYRLALRWADGFIAVADDVKPAIKQAYGDLPDEKISVICNSVDSRRYHRAVDRKRIRRSLGLPDGVRLGVVVATFKEQKGHRFLIEAAPQIVHQFPDFHVLFVGDGELRQELERQVAAAGMNGHIHFLGTRNDVPDLLAASDLFILPSLWEGLSMALVEAMASALPIVATEVSGTRQVITANETGVLVPPGQSEALASAVSALLGDPEEALKMGARARRRVDEKFSAQKQAEDHIALFKTGKIDNRSEAR